MSIFVDSVLFIFQNFDQCPGVIKGIAPFSSFLTSKNSDKLITISLNELINYSFELIIDNQFFQQNS